ncbi:MAG: peroxidase-related enzyme [Burkholderiaceae bacterium]|nr:peroxidase-related enzyme [Burkholderiaceae bacterium]MCD8517062.1 peroxidase-related enzyme [Burkholderiaceae bacterium]MCD8536890.1 peroxidase-related enzyme [Burkholderiaceae bacterium]MCD8566083.1 peroxidase-related enzyme [Burkholderiaceae bacterium]
MTRTSKPISCFSVPEIDSLPNDIRERLQTVEQKAGFIPNVMRVLARRPAEFRAFMAYHDALMEGDSGLTKAEREMIVVATSGANHCQYCVVAHGAILRIRAKNPLIADQVATNYRQADISLREKAILDYAMKVSRQSAEVTQADRDTAKAAGLSDEDLWDIASISAFFAMSNRLASATEMRPNDEFFAMGR